MIIDRIENWPKYFSHPSWKKAFDFIEKADLNLPDGRVDIDGDEIYASVSRYKTKPICELKLEAHRTYTDIQIILKGKEQIAWHPIGDMKFSEKYDEQKDVTFFCTPKKILGTNVLSPGCFAVFFPEDGHAPCISIDDLNPEEILKIVVKIKKHMC